MLRLTFLLRKKPELSHDEFYRYWLEEHGPLVASHARRLGALRYVQVHTLRDEAALAAAAGMAKARGGMEPIYDGVAEVWFESRAALLEAAFSPAGRTAASDLVKDEAKFIDLPNSPLWLGHEFPQVNPTPENLVATPRSGLVKLYFPLRMKTALALGEAHVHWYANHGPLIRRQAAGSGIRRYVQVHRVRDERLDAAFNGARGTAVEAYDGHAELWFERDALAGSTPERVEAGRRAVADEAHFIDFKRSAIWLAKEHVFVDHL
ncbi:MAG: EthD domain-containing protein [Gammaproteobacteria bacterium]|nr:EthD domain-containing protein [Gammaproteobacteria bacterium]